MKYIFHNDAQLALSEIKLRCFALDLFYKTRLSKLFTGVEICMDDGDYPGTGYLLGLVKRTLIKEKIIAKKTGALSPLKTSELNAINNDLDELRNCCSSTINSMLRAESVMSCLTLPNIACFVLIIVLAIIFTFRLAA